MIKKKFNAKNKRFQLFGTKDIASTKDASYRKAKKDINKAIAKYHKDNKFSLKQTFLLNGSSIYFLPYNNDESLKDYKGPVYYLQRNVNEAYNNKTRNSG